MILSLVYIINMPESRAGIRLRTKEWLKDHFSNQQRFLFLCIICGVVCGLVAVSFHLCIEAVFGGTMWVADYLQEHRLLFLFPLIPTVGGLIVGVSANTFAKGSAGGGIPQIKIAYYRDFGIMKFRQGFWRYILCVISMGTGASLGREAPTMHICATVASKIGQFLGIARMEIRALVPVGMGAGLAAAFNTPIAAITYVFEDLFEGFSAKGLGGILIAVVVAATVERSILGENPMFSLDLPTFRLEWWLLICLPLGVFAGIVGQFFTSGMLNCRKFFRKNKKIPAWFRPVIGGFGIGVLGICIYGFLGTNGVLGTGHHSLTLILQEKYVWYVLLALFLGKIVGSVLCYATDCCGGVFAPTLFIGGAMGALVGCAIVPFIDNPNSIVAACALLGMGALFAAVIRAPITSILIIFEMTREYSLILPLMVGNMLAYFIATKLQFLPLDDASLTQDGVKLKRPFEYESGKDWRNLPISAIATYNVITVTDSMLPSDALKSVEQTPHHSYPVVTSSGKLCGIVLHRELEEWSREETAQTIGVSLFGRKLVAMLPMETIHEVANKLVLSEVEQAPIVGGLISMKLVGIVTLHDIARQQNRVGDE